MTSIDTTGLGSYGVNSAASVAASLLTAATSGVSRGNTIGQVSAATLTAYYNAKEGIKSSTGSAAAGTTPKYVSTPPTTAALTNGVLAGGAFVDPASVKLSATASETASQAADYKRLFAVYQALTALSGLAGDSASSSATTAQQSALQTTFARGLTEIQRFLASQPFQNLTVADGTVKATAQSNLPITTTPSATYTTRPIDVGSASDPVAAFQGAVQFNLTAASAHGASTSVALNLDDLGSAPRSLDNVVNYFNAQLSAAGVKTTFSVVRTPGVEQTTTANGKTVDLGVKSADTYALQIDGAAGETISLTAPATTPGVYVAQNSGITPTTAAANALVKDTAGATADATRQIVKLNGDASATGAASLSTTQLPPGVAAIRSQVVGADGSLYVLADLTGTAPDGQTIQGAGDVALLKYDSAGGLQYSRTLGAANSASGYALALSADGGQVAVAGSVTGPLAGAAAADGVGATAKTPQSFVSVYESAHGEERWSQTAAAAGPSSATGVAFGADGAVYVAGNASSLAGATDAAFQQGYLQSFTPTAVTAFDGSVSYSVTASQPTSLGTGLGVLAGGVATTADGGVVVTTLENGEAGLSRFDGPLGSGVRPSATRDLGSLGTGQLAGLVVADDGSLIVAGSTSTGGLVAGTATTAYAGGRQAFVADLAADLSASPGDTLTYVDTGAGDATATALSVSGGRVYLAGAVVGDPSPASRGSPTQRGYALALDPATGTVGWSDTLAGADDQSAPTSIAVAASGASVLDQLGLPQGTIASDGDQTLVAKTSVRAGDQFYVRSGTGAAVAVTITNSDTLQTLAVKVDRALGYAGTAAVVATTPASSAASTSSTATSSTTAGAPAVVATGKSELKITPNGFTTIELEAGPAGADALAALGLSAGLITAKATPSAAAKAASTTATPYALGLGTSLDVSTAAGAKNAQTLITAALTTIKDAYTALGAPPSRRAGVPTGTVPAYVTARIANYQAALTRLTGSPRG